MTTDVLSGDPAGSEIPSASPPPRSYALLVASGILLSRLAGLIRERVFAHYLGNSAAAGAFKAALRIPNFLQNLFGEGVLSASFIPVYARLLAKKEDALAGRVAGVVASILALVTSVLVLLGVLFTPFLVTLIAPGFQGELRLLTIRIVRILFPGIGLLVLSAWCLGILNSHRKFFISYVAPVFWNIAMIATLIIFGASHTGGSLAVMLAWGTLVGCVLQFGIQLPFVLKASREIRLALDTSLEPVRDIMRNFVPVAIGRGVVQVSAYVDEMIASFLGAAAVASLSYAQTIYLLPISLFGMSVAASELPQMSSAVGTDEEVRRALRARIEAGQRQIAFFVVPTVVAFVLIGRFLVAALYQTGRFGAGDTTYVWYILAAYSIGLLAATMGRLYSSALYALRDTKSPLKIAIVRVTIAATLGVLAVFPFRMQLLAFLTDVLRIPMPEIAGGEKSLAVIGLTIATGLAAWIELYLLRRKVIQRVGPVDSAMGFVGKATMAALAGGIAAWSAARWLSPAAESLLAPLGAWRHVVIALILCGVFGVIYLSAAAAMRIPEVRKVTRRIFRPRS